MNVLIDPVLPTATTSTGTTLLGKSGTDTEIDSTTTTPLLVTLVTTIVVLTVLFSRSMSKHLVKDVTMDVLQISVLHSIC